MNELDKSNQEDQDLHQFFDELKSIEKKQPAPSFESMVENTKVKKSHYSFLRYAAVFAVLILGFSAYQWIIDVSQPSIEITEITISYGASEEEDEEENLLSPTGMDQWQSETDILLTGL